MSYYNYVLKMGTILFITLAQKKTVRMVHLYKDGLYLNNYGKDELANNFVDNIDSFSLENIFQMNDFRTDNV